MKHNLKLLAFAVLLPVAAFAQASLDEEVNAELDRMYQGQASAPIQAQAQKTGPAVQVNVQAQPTVTTSQLNNQSANQGAAQTAGQNQAQNQLAQQQVQKQPTTYIEASPLIESRAEKIRKTRQDAEISTEQTIVEKLESARLEDEKRRAEVLFGDKFNSLANQNQQQVVVQPAAPAPVEVAPVPVVVPEQTVQPAPTTIVIREEKKDDEIDREAIRGEVSAALAELKTTQTPEEKPPTRTYISLMAGSGEYPDAVNVKGQYSLGVAIGKKFTDRLLVEGSFQYSNYQVEQPATYGNGGCIPNYYGGCDYYPRITDMNQYGTSALVKYQILGGALRPEVGGLMTYTYRTFTDKQFAISDATLSSQALDLGLMVGASLELTESFALGLDYRYMWNMTNKIDGTSLQKSSIYQQQSNYTPIEELSYYNLSVVGRATF